MGIKRNKRKTEQGRLNKKSSLAVDKKLNKKKGSPHPPTIIPSPGRTFLHLYIKLSIKAAARKRKLKFTKQQ